VPIIISSLQIVKLDSGALSIKRSFKYHFFPVHISALFQTTGDIL